MREKFYLLTYQHTSDKEIVSHKIAPFDIGTTNPETYERNKNNVYAYCYDHVDENGQIDPKVFAFNINIFILISENSQTFDPIF